MLNVNYIGKLTEPYAPKRWTNRTNAFKTFLQIGVFLKILGYLKVFLNNIKNFLKKTAY